MQYLYRYERSLFDEEFSSAKVILKKFKVLRLTPKGFWIKIYGCEKWVSNDCKKRYAYPSTDEAMTNFKARTLRCIKILKSQLRRAEAFRDAIQSGTLKVYESTYTLS